MYSSHSLEWQCFPELWIRGLDNREPMIRLELRNPEAKQLQTKGQFSASRQTTSSLRRKSHHVVQGPTQMEAISFQRVTLERIKGCSEEDAFSKTSSSPGRLSCIHANKRNRTRAEHPTDACASLYFSVAYMLLFYLHMGCPVLLQGVQHEQKKTQTMDRAGPCLPAD